jgi:hypothetical protein
VVAAAAAAASCARLGQWGGRLLNGGEGGGDW